jgi:hypothetical protein
MHIMHMHLCCYSMKLTKNSKDLRKEKRGKVSFIIKLIPTWHYRLTKLKKVAWSVKKISCWLILKKREDDSGILLQHQFFLYFFALLFVVPSAFVVTPPALSFVDTCIVFQNSPMMHDRYPLKIVLQLYSIIPL